MGVTVRKKAGKWFVFINHNGRRKAKCVGDSRAAALKVKAILEAKLTLGGVGVFDESAPPRIQTFGAYADGWLKDYAKLVCKKSTVDGYEGSLRQYLLPRFASKRLDAIKRNDIKALIADMISRELARATLRNALSVLRSIFNYAIEEGLFDSNPAARLGKFTRTAKTPTVKGIALTIEEVEAFLQAAARFCLVYYPLFILAVRAGLRRGELVAIEWADIEFGRDESDTNRFILVQHNDVRRQHTATKSRKTRRVDMSRELRKTLIELRDARLRAASSTEKADISTERVFASLDGMILDPDDLYHRYFIPVLEASGIRKIRLRDLRHTFESLLIQSGVSIVYVKDQMGHSSIQVTVDTYGHLIPCADISYFDLLDRKSVVKHTAYRQQSATPAQPDENLEAAIPAYLVDLSGGGARDRTADLRVMNPSL